MPRKPLVLRAVAEQDTDAAISHYRNEGGADVALAFVMALEKLYSRISSDPGIGSPRYAHELDLPALRHKLLRPFPWAIFYMEQEDHIDVWRILHTHRDIPEWLAGPSSDA
ncbi:toxin ParE1/3/4 [Sphingopyxis sp. YR583]|uniref:type II toxin-antitoxin system RelE/ParE family toxin n=1 Tax=Sphingopyxis sp. YR583 TaxID=1881047 RepID=UPI0008A7ABF2|nr:type II toxin-antitoxin system RelE/ParE family toxin [Sphingopyxis sp. YR583]SEH12939.1 toxin ParE1/3/4 [Sphingopyxis sp. YR583]